MNRIQKLFAEADRPVLSVYFCAGHPTFDSTLPVLEALDAAGVRMVEIGIPFSDPMADGPVIQDAATKALRNGMTLRRLFSQLRDVRSHTDMPLILMGYLNPIMQYGFENFCHSCRECGIDGIIIPDLPFKEYIENYKEIAERHDLKMIMLITGAQKNFDEQRQAYFRHIESMRLKRPRMIGFGISNRQTFETACAHASGAIIGSKFVSLLEEECDTDRAIKKLLEALYESNGISD